MNTMSSAALLETDVRLAMTGDHDAYHRLVEQSANVVCAIALAIVRNVQASEDVAQEVFLAVWTNLNKLRNPASFLPWLRQLTRNQANLWIRNHSRERSDEDALAAAVDARPTPADSLLRDEERRVLADVIADLPEESREVVILYYREGSSAKHVADLLGISWENSSDLIVSPPWRARESFLSPVKTGSHYARRYFPTAESRGLRFLRRLRRRCVAGRGLHVVKRLPLRPHNPFDHLRIVRKQTRVR